MSNKQPFLKKKQPNNSPHIDIRYSLRLQANIYALFDIYFNIYVMYDTVVNWTVQQQWKDGFTPTVNLILSQLGFLAQQ